MSVRDCHSVRTANERVNAKSEEDHHFATRVVATSMVHHAMDAGLCSARNECKHLSIERVL